MRQLLSTLGVALLLVASATVAQQTASPTTGQSGASSAQSSQSTSGQTGVQSTLPSTIPDQSNPQGGAPNSAIPGRVTGATPTAVQQELERQLPAGSQVTASVADDGSLKLTGTVRSDADKAKAAEIAKQVSNKNVDNQIQVKAGLSPDQGAVPK